MARSLPPAAGGILSYFTRHRTAANLLLLMLLAIGAAVLPKLRTQFFPDIVISRITVSVEWPGAGAEDVDRGIVQVLEPALLSVDGVKSSSTISREGSGVISLEFEPGWDMGRGEDEVKAAIDAVNTLPEDAERPDVRREAWRDRVTDVVITGPVAVEQLARFADEFTSRLFARGVTRTTIRGVAAPQIVIEVPGEDLIRHDLSMAEIAAAIAGEAAADPAGEVRGANARVRTGIARRTAREVAGIVLSTAPDGTPLTIGDVARVRVEGPDRERAYFQGKNPAISLRVDRSAGGDAVAIQKTVEEVAAEMERILPPGVEITLIRTRAEAISARLNMLMKNGLTGLALVLALLFLFLNARTAFWVAVGIPVSVLTALALMYAAGLTINMISLFALIITLGMVVDDAIVVGEHADFRARVLGEPPVIAAENAARRMAAPVFSATLTTVIAFFTLVVVGGSMGRLIADIPFTVIAVLSASLLECFLILPNHMAHALAHSVRTHWYDLPSRAFNRAFFAFRRRFFRPLMGLVVRLRYPVLAAAVVLLAWQVSLVIRGDVQWRFFNAPERPSITGNFAMSDQATRADTLEQMHMLQRVVEEMGRKYAEKYDRNPLKFVLAGVGGTSGPGLAGADEKNPDLLGNISIELIDPDLRPYSSFRFLADLQKALQRHPLAETVSFRGWHQGPSGDAIAVDFHGSDAATLKAAAEALKAALSVYPEVSGLEDTLAYDKAELVLDLTPRGKALGFAIEDLSRVLRNRINGIEAASFPVGARSAKITVELPQDEHAADFLDRMQIRTKAGTYVPLSDIVSVSESRGFATVRRENGLRLVSVTGSLSEDDPARASEIMEALRQRILPEIERDYRVAWKLSGQAEDERAFLSDALLGFLLGLTGIYLTLAWIFASWLRPLVVMAIIPFGLVGTIFGHALHGVPLSMFSVVGLLGMTGIIINDSIVLVTTIDEYARERGLVPAIIDGTADRLRAVLLTTLTTVFGLAPLLFESSTQAQFLKPTVITLVYGLGFGMLLVLLVVPALIAMQLDIGRSLRALRRALRIPSRPLPRRGRLVRRLALTAALLIAASFAATLASALIAGHLPAPLLAAFPFLAGLPALPAAFFLFVLLSGAIALGTWITGVVMVRRARRTPKAG